MLTCLKYQFVAGIIIVWALFLATSAQAEGLSAERILNSEIFSVFGNGRASLASKLNPIRKAKFQIAIKKNWVEKRGPQDFVNMSELVCRAEGEVGVFDIRGTNEAFPLEQVGACDTTLDLKDGSSSANVHITFGGPVLIGKDNEVNPPRDIKAFAPWMLAKVNTQTNWITNNLILTPDLNSKELRMVLQDQSENFFQNQRLAAVVSFSDQ